jgi:hypothetical protein
LEENMATPLEQLQASIDAGNIAEANQFIADEAQKAGVDPAAAPRNERGQFVKRDENAPETEEKPATVEFRQEVELAKGKFLTVTGASEEEVAAKAALVQQTAAALAEKAKEAAPEAPAPKLTEDDLFDLGTKLVSGKVEAVTEYLDRSGYLDAALEKRGIKPADLIKQAEAAQAQEWSDATTQFQVAHPEYIANKRNLKIMGVEIAMLKAKDPKLAPLEAIEKAYSVCLEDPDCLDVKNATSVPINEPAPKKARSSSALFATGGENAVRRTTNPQGAVTQAELDAAMRLAPREMATWWNDQVRLGRVPQQ